MFILIAILVLFGTSWFTAATWTHFTGMSAWVWQFGALAVVGVFVGVIFVSFRRQHFLLRVAGRLSAVLVGFLNFALLAAIVCWLTLGVSRVAGLALEPERLAWVLYGIAVLTTAYGLANAARLRVTKITVQLPNLPESWPGREVALVTDLHVGNIRGAGFIRRVVARLKQLNPAAVFIAGDMFDGAKVDIARSVEPWAEFHPPAGIYFATGNHDEFSDPRAYLAALTAVGVRVLNNEKVTVDGLQIIGVHDGETHRPATYREILRHAAIERDRPSILIAHHPAHLEIPEAEGISLQVSGHTHQGQFWPWSLLVKRIYGPFAYGLNRFGNLQIFTSSGAGSWGPPMRVGTKSEIVLLRLERSEI